MRTLTRAAYRRIIILEAMIDNRMISNSIASQDSQLNEMKKWDDNTLNAVERMLKIPTSQKEKVGSQKVYENGAVLSAKDRKWAIGVADKFEANPELYDPRWINKRKIGS